jgi:hypothetical protein
MEEGTSSGRDQEKRAQKQTQQKFTAVPRAILRQAVKLSATLVCQHHCSTSGARSHQSSMAILRQFNDKSVFLDGLLSQPFNARSGSFYLSADYRKE